MKQGFQKLDVFKLLVLLILIVWFVLFVTERKPTQPGYESSRTASDQLADPAKEEINTQAEYLEIPDWPEGYAGLILNQEKKNLVDGIGKAVFILDEKNSRWIPVIQGEIEKILPADYQIGSDEFGTWFIYTSSGEALYYLDRDALEWMPIPDEDELAEAPEDEGLSNDKEIECAGANPARISGAATRVEVINALIPLRSSPSALASNILKPLPIGTRLEVLSLPVCVPYLEGANLWWEVRTEDGEIGFAAEGSAINPTYYLSEIR